LPAPGPGALKLLWQPPQGKYWAHRWWNTRRDHPDDGDRPSHGRHQGRFRPPPWAAPLRLAESLTMNPIENAQRDRLPLAGSRGSTSDQIGNHRCCFVFDSEHFAHIGDRAQPTRVVHETREGPDPAATCAVAPAPAEAREYDRGARLGHPPRRAVRSPSFPPGIHPRPVRQRPSEPRQPGAPCMTPATCTTARGVPGCRHRCVAGKPEARGLRHACSVRAVRRQPRPLPSLHQSHLELSWPQVEITLRITGQAP